MTRVFSGKQPTELYRKALATLMSDADDVIQCEPRGKRIREIRPVVFDFENSVNRVTFAKGRVVNPFFQLAESLWILAGRADVEWLSFYNKNMKNFSDNGIFFNAPYGERLRAWNSSRANEFVFNPIDQLADCYRKLSQDPDTRQAVAVISNPMFDNSSYTIDRKGKDIACLSGDTVVNSPEGDITMEELARRFRFNEIDKYPVYSYDSTMKKKVLKYATMCWKTKTDTTYMIELNNGTKIKATADHLFFVRQYRGEHEISKSGKNMVRRKTEIVTKRLDELEEGDVLIPLGIQHNRKGENGIYPYALHSGREGLIENVDKLYIDLLYQDKEYSFNPNTHKIFHRNWDVNDNRESNLLVVTNAKYFELQAKREQEQTVEDYAEIEELNSIKFNKATKMEEEARTKNWYIKLALSIIEEYNALTKDLVYDRVVELGLPPSTCLGEINRLFKSFMEYKAKIQKMIPDIDLNSTTSGMEYKLSPTRVKKIDMGNIEDVYDLIVPDTHCFFANGLLVHNCNLIVTFKIRENKLDITVFNRSNDLHWGTFGANLCQFTTIQSAMASWLGIEVGSYHQITDSLHIYLDDYGAKETEKMMKAYGDITDESIVELDGLIQDEVLGFTSSFEQFHSYLNGFFSYLDVVACRPDTYTTDEIFNQLLHSVGTIEDNYFKLCIYAMIAYHAHKEGHPDKVILALDKMPRGKWQVACLRFLSPKYRDNEEFKQLVNSYENIQIINYIYRKDII